MARTYNIKDFSDLPENNHSVDLDPLFLPVDLTVPDCVKDRIPKKELRSINGSFILRFFPNIPIAIGHTIERNGHVWRIVGICHAGLQVKGSPKEDSYPIIDLEYVGKKNKKRSH